MYESVDAPNLFDLRLNHDRLGAGVDRMTYKARARKSRLDQVMEQLTGWSAGMSATDILRAGKIQVAKQARGLTTKRRTGFSAAFAAA